MAKRKKEIVIPDSALLKAELEREKHRQHYRNTLRSTIYTLITVAAMAVLAAILWLPVLKIYGNSMTPTLNQGEYIMTVKTDKFETGDLIAFYYNNKVLVKRVIASSGEWVDIDEDGTVKVNGEVIEEPYLDNKAFGECNIELPYQVPEGKVFVMGDHRDISIDSRNTAVGCVSEEQIVGKLFLRFWPFESFEPMY